MLEELGRVAVLDKDSCHAMAVDLCEIQPPTTHAGAAGLRRHGSTTTSVAATRTSCGDPSSATINGFQYEYPGTTYRAIIDTLRRHADEWEAEWRRKEAPA